MINAFAVLICLLCPTGDFKVNQKVSSEVFFSFFAAGRCFCVICYLASRLVDGAPFVH